MVKEVDEILLHKFETKEEKTAHTDKLNFWEKEECELAKDDYTKFSIMIRKELSAVYGTMISICHVIVINRSETEEDF